MWIWDYWARDSKIGDKPASDRPWKQVFQEQKHSSFIQKFNKLGLISSVSKWKQFNKG